jgi:hypothetical protein
MAPENAFSVENGNTSKVEKIKQLLNSGAIVIKIRLMSHKLFFIFLSCPLIYGHMVHLLRHVTIEYRGSGMMVWG